ncbi:hypothetical protein V8B97DRAFT_1917594 [Scleroderma yunnanense]
MAIPVSPTKHLLLSSREQKRKDDPVVVDNAAGKNEPGSTIVYKCKKNAKWHTSPKGNLGSATDGKCLEVIVQGGGGSSISSEVIGGIGNPEEANVNNWRELMPIFREHGFDTQFTTTGSTNKTSPGTGILSAADKQHLEVTVQGNCLSTEFSDLGDSSALVICSDVLCHSEETNNKSWEDSMSLSSFCDFVTQATTNTGNTNKTSSEAPQSIVDGQHLGMAVQSDHFTETSQGGLANNFSNESALVKEINHKDWEESMSNISFHGFSGQDTSIRNPNNTNQGAAFSNGVTTAKQIPDVKMSNAQAEAECSQPRDTNQKAALATSDADLQEDKDGTEQGDEDANIFENIEGQTVIRQDVEMSNAVQAEAECSQFRVSADVKEK